MKYVSFPKRTSRDRKIQSNTKSKVKDAKDNKMLAIITNGLMCVCVRVFVSACVCVCVECECVFVDE